MSINYKIEVDRAREIVIRNIEPFEAESKLC